MLGLLFALILIFAKPPRYSLVLLLSEILALLCVVAAFAVGLLNRDLGSAFAGGMFSTVILAGMLNVLIFAAAGCAVIFLRKAMGSKASPSREAR